jgi:adenylosuccinate lyase
VVLAEAQAELGLLADDRATPRITPAQIAELKAMVDQIDFRRADELEMELQHDVMAHIHAYGEVCPGAADIIHLGATSCYVTDNTDLILIRQGLQRLREQLIRLIDAFGTFALKYRDTATLGYTHYQPAQLTTVGKRASLWCYDFILDLREIDHRLETLAFRGVKGTTGTQASFLALFHGDHEKVRQLDSLVARKMGFKKVAAVTGQTYSRKLDSQILDVLSGLGQSAHKYGSDLRLLAHEQELEEPFGARQVGSSAMPYKRNPMKAERMCGLARFLSSLSVSAAQTAASQWLERTLDDSVNRRLTLPQAFLTADAVLKIALNITRGLVVNKEVIARNVRRFQPYMATETLLMEAVARGGDRQKLHEIIRELSHDVTARLKSGAEENDLLQRLKQHPAFEAINFDRVLTVDKFVGRAPQQVDEFLAEEVEPIRKREQAL